MKGKIRNNKKEVKSRRKLKDKDVAEIFGHTSSAENSKIPMFSSDDGGKKQINKKLYLQLKCIYNVNEIELVKNGGIITLSKERP